MLISAMECAGIGLNADEVEILTHPTDFYNQLLRNIENAQNRLVLSSLYIGGDEMAVRLYQTIEEFCARGGEALIILDYNRGQRGARSGFDRYTINFSKFPKQPLSAPRENSSAKFAKNTPENCVSNFTSQFFKINRKLRQKYLNSRRPFPLNIQKSTPVMTSSFYLAQTWKRRIL